MTLSEGRRSRGLFAPGDRHQIGYSINMGHPEPLAIIIASKNRPKDIIRALTSIVAQSVPAADVLVVDQSPVAYDLSAFPGVRHVHDTSISGLTVARNRGIDLIEAPRVLFLDDDVELPPGTIAALQAAFDAHPDAIGFQCDDLEIHDYGRLNDLLDAIFSHGFFTPRRRIRRGNDIEVTSLGGFAMAYRTSVFAHERFDEGLRGYSFGEDWDFSRRAARYGRLLVAPGAELHHYHSPANRSGARDMCRMRWANYHYFYQKWYTSPPAIERLNKEWWKVGETYRWLRAGLGFPSNRKAAKAP